jgi:membrane protein
MKDTLLRAIGSFRRHGMTDWGASMTYYLVMALFPALLVAVSLLGVFGEASLITDATRYLRDAGAPHEVVGAVETSMESLIQASGEKAGVALVFGLVIGLNGASGAFGAAGRALNIVYAADEDRGFVRRKLVDLAFTSLVIVLGLVALVSVLLGGSVAKDLLGTIGLGETAATIWLYARWPVAVLAMMLVFAIVYAFAPDHERRRFRWISPGSVLGVTIWLVASALFFLYVRSLGNYGATYGAFAGAVILLLWLYLTSLAFLLGGELNGEIERAQLAGRGGPPPPTPPPTPEHPVPTPVAPPAAQDAAD